MSPKYKYIGDSTPFINNGDILEQTPVTWSIKKGDNRIEVSYLYVKDFRGNDFPINIKKFEKL